MRYLFAIAATLTVGLVCQQVVEAGAKNGKMRWSSNTAIKNRKPAIKVPEASGKEPGKVELKIVFKAKELAEFCVIGDADTDIDLIVKDAKGKTVAEDVDPAERGSDICLCRWTPDHEQEYTVIILNHGRVYNLVQAGCN
jgi:hypothetical protein